MSGGPNLNLSSLWQNFRLHGVAVDKPVALSKTELVNVNKNLDAHDFGNSIDVIKGVI